VTLDTRVRELEEQLRRVERERDILKKSRQQNLWVNLGSGSAPRL
jgi:hypothetical protein